MKFKDILKTDTNKIGWLKVFKKLGADDETIKFVNNEINNIVPQNPYTEVFNDPINNILLQDYNTKKTYELYDFGGEYGVNIPLGDYESTGFRFTLIDKNTQKYILAGILQYRKDEDHSVKLNIYSMQNTITIFELKGGVDDEEDDCITRILFCIHNSVNAFASNIECKLLSLNIRIIV